MRTEIDGKSIVVSFGYNPDLVQQIKAAPDGRRYRARTKDWVLPLTADNLRHLQEIGAGDFSALVAEIEAPLKTTLTGNPCPNLDIVWPVTPFAHQKTGYLYLACNNSVYLGWEMGLGKTLAVIMGAVIPKYDANQSILIVCPRAVVRSWAAELKKYAPGVEFVCSVDEKKKTKKVLGPVTVCHYDQLLHHPELVNAPWDVVIIDEAHWIKNSSAKRSKLLHQITGRASTRVLMSGTPITQGPEDIFSQWLALDGGRTFGTSFYSFRAKFSVDRGHGFPDWQIRPGMEKLLHEKMLLKMDRRLKAECLDLPPKNYQTVYVDMTPEQGAAYKEMKKSLQVTLESGEEISTQYMIVQLQKLNQITSGFIYADGKTHHIPSNKMRVLRETIEGQKKVVVWCLFREDIRAIMEEFADMHPVEVEDWEIFQSDPSVNMLVGQVHAGGLGITLTASQLVVYYSQGYSLADRLQNEDRTHRIGTTGMVTYIDMVCPGTIDEDILTILAEKRKTADRLTGDSEIISRLKSSIID